MDTATIAPSKPVADSMSSVGPEANGMLTFRNFLDMLLDLPMDAKYFVTMQESKSFPVEVELHHRISLRDEGEIWRVSTSTRRQGKELLPLQRAQAKDIILDRLGSSGPATTVRELIHTLMGHGFQPDDIVDLGGHFYTSFYLRVYPATPKVTVRINSKEVVSIRREEIIEDELPSQASTSTGIKATRIGKILGLTD